MFLTTQLYKAPVISDMMIQELKVKGTIKYLKLQSNVELITKE